MSLFALIGEIVEYPSTYLHPIDHGMDSLVLICLVQKHITYASGLVL